MSDSGPNSLDCFEFHAALATQLNDAQASLDDARARDIQVIAQEAYIAGFQPSQMKIRPSGFIIFYTTIGRISQATLNGHATCWSRLTPQGGVKPTDGTITDHHIKSLQWTASQVFFLEWTRTLAVALAKFWAKETAFKTIEKFIVNQKQICKTVFGHAVKRALSDVDAHEAAAVDSTVFAGIDAIPNDDCAISTAPAPPAPPAPVSPSDTKRPRTG